MTNILPDLPDNGCSVLRISPRTLDQGQWVQIHFFTLGLQWDTTFVTSLFASLVDDPEALLELDLILKEQILSFRSYPK